MFQTVQFCFVKFSMLKEWLNVFLFGMDKILFPSLCYYIWHFFLPNQSLNLDIIYEHPKLHLVHSTTHPAYTHKYMENAKVK